jgi:uncharacterized protein (DUF952 family)
LSGVGTIYHLALATPWSEALRNGRYDGTADDRRDGAPFPHVYGTLPLHAIRRTTPLPLDADGRHVFPALDA